MPRRGNQPSVKSRPLSTPKKKVAALPIREKTIAALMTIEKTAAPRKANRITASRRRRARRDAQVAGGKAAGSGWGAHVTTARMQESG